MEKRIEQTISSMEVAEMVGKAHNDLMKDIRRYCEQLSLGKIPQSDFFTESTYVMVEEKSILATMSLRKVVNLSLTS